MKRTSPTAWDQALTALQSVRAKAHFPHEYSAAIREACREIQEQLRRMLEYPPISEKSADLHRLHERLDRICQLSNQMECGSLIIEISQAMDAAWKRMP